MLPLVLTIAQLAILHPTGEAGLYIYGKEALGKGVGVLSTLIYFIAKVLSCSIMIRVFVFNLCTIVPVLSVLPLFVIRLSLLIILLILNLFGIRFGLRVQACFIFLKLLPIVFVIGGGLFIFNVHNLSLLPKSFGDFTSTLPLALYPMMGFETCCAVGHLAIDAKKMAYTVIGSFLGITFLCILLQFLLFTGVGLNLVGSLTPLTLFFEVLFKGSAGGLLTLLGIMAIMISALGAAYSILYTISWYPFVIGKELGFNLLAYKNRHGSPVVALLIHASLIGLSILLPDYLGVLGRLSVLGCLVIYLTMTFALLVLYKRRAHEVALPYWVAVLSLVSCTYIAFTCIKDFF